MNRTLISALIASCCSIAAGSALVAQQPKQSKSLQALVKEIAALERAATAVWLEMETTGRLPDGSEFRTSGSLRVLGETHVRSIRRSHFGEGMVAETETIRTPDGMMMREKDPVQGELYTSMSAELLRRIESARDFLGQNGSLDGVAGRPGDAPLGSSMLEGLNRQYTLEVSGPKMIDGQRCWVVGGPVRAEIPDDAALSGLGADHVDVLVRERDVAVVKMTHLKAGKPVLEVVIKRLELDRPLGREAFVLELPKDVEAIDVMAHPPARAQIERILKEAGDAGWKDVEDGGKARTGSDKG